MSHGLILTGGGIGRRFGHSTPKQCLDWQGHPLWIYTLSKFKNAEFITDVVVTFPSEHCKDARAALESIEWPFNVSVINGGDTRANSVYAGVQSLMKQSPNCSKIWIHDAVRPLISPDLIQIIYSKSTNCSGVIPALPLTDTIKHVADDLVVATVDRSTMMRVQTPQVFDSNHLLKAYETLEYEFYTDETQLFEAMKLPVNVVEGETRNIKITTPDDWELFKFYSESESASR